MNNAWAVSIDRNREDVKYLMWCAILKNVFSSRFRSILTAQALCIYGHICTVLPNQNLITSFKDFHFVFGAKVIYFLWRIQIWKKIWRARTSARATRQTTLGIRPKTSSKTMKIMIFHFLKRIERAHKRAHLKVFFLESNSLNIIDDFCTLNESKILTIHNYR